VFPVIVPLSNTASYNVYFGTTGNMVLQGSQAATSFDPGTLTYAATGSWQLEADRCFQIMEDFPEGVRFCCATTEC